MQLHYVHKPCWLTAAEANRLDPVLKGASSPNPTSSPNQVQQHPAGVNMFRDIQYLLLY